MQIDLVNIYYLLAGVIVCAIGFLFVVAKQKKEIKALKCQYEKKSIGMDDSSLKIKTLENKIKTLEAALKRQ